MSNKKVIVISGGSDGLGKAIAAACAAQYQVVILTPHEEKLRKVAKELGVDFRLCDVTDQQSIEETVKSIVEQYAQIDCLVNNAGLWIEGPLTENDPQHIQRVIGVNTLGTILLTRATLPTMIQQQSGIIMNIISQGGLHTKAERSVYTASKFAITGFTRSLQEELEPHHIRVIGIYPGKMNTPLFEKQGVHKDMSNALDPAAVAKLVGFVLEQDAHITFPELGIQYME